MAQQEFVITFLVDVGSAVSRTVGGSVESRENYVANTTRAILRMVLGLQSSATKLHKLQCRCVHDVLVKMTPMVITTHHLNNNTTTYLQVQVL